MNLKKRPNIPIFTPHVSTQMRHAVFNALKKRIIGQGEQVNLFEHKLGKYLNTSNVLTLNSGTSGLELVCELLNLRLGDEVITPVFTCTATNIPLVRRGVKLVFADINKDMHLNWTDAKNKITKKTKAIINVHLFNRFSAPHNVPVPVIGDAAQYLGKTEGERFTAYSFQATKIITTVDGGALICQREEDYKRGKLLRWYGIDRETGKSNIDVDIQEAGFKYHMNNVAAAMGLAGLQELNKRKGKITKLQNLYKKQLKDVSFLTPIGGSPFLVHTHHREKIIKTLAKKGVEASLVHKRNDIYSIFGGKRLKFPNMNKLEETYLLLPCRANMAVKDVEYICSIIKKL